MKKSVLFIYSIIAYLIGFVSLLIWIISLTPLIPAISIDGDPSMPFALALLKNLTLIAAFGLQHSIMARKSFKNVINRFIPEVVERSNFVLASGIMLAFLVWQWEPMGGQVWEVQAGSTAYLVMYGLFVAGWAILFISTFLINHFDLFGLRQTWLNLKGKPYSPLQFKVYSFYKYVRHPLYFGGILGLWACPDMTVTHLVFAIGLTSYFIIGAGYEEKDLVAEFGNEYREYQKKAPMMLPVPKSTSAKNKLQQQTS